jgi:S1-C subfamily serine protease
MSSHGLRVCVSSDTSLSPVVVEEVAAGGQAAALGVQRGDHITSVEGSTAFTDVDSMIVLVKAQTRPVKVSIIA